jgi:methionine sulfoxide reductase heme-binding subunit
MEKLIALLDPLWPTLFRLHDWSADTLGRNIVATKRLILIVAHVSLLGFLFPELRKEFGELAANLLILILFLSPLSKIFRMRFLLLAMSLRRELGIAMGYLATVHGVGYLIDPDWFDFIVRPYLTGDFFGPDPRYLFGLLAYALTLPLLFTSNALSQRLLGGARWKLLHRLVYLLFAFAILHRFFVRGAPPTVVAEIILLLGAYALAKLLAWKNVFPPLVQAIELVSFRYRSFRAASAPPAQVPGGGPTV